MTPSYRLLNGILFSFLFLLVSGSLNAQETVNSWIRINQLGYKPSGVKVAVFGSKLKSDINDFELIDARSSKVVLKLKAGKDFGKYGPFVSSYRLDFTDFEKAGKYYLKSGNVQSATFEISKDVLKGSADFTLRYMRQQRSGYNPYLKDSCHRKDGYIIYGPVPDNTFIDVSGGWHDASDYLQYSTTSANATYHLLAAYRDFPKSFSDHHLANGLEGKNGIADVLDEARWGLDWLLKMHPKEDWLFNQIADDRDHAGYRLPNKDSIDYGYGKGTGRPVYFITGQPQGLGKYKNRATGAASTAGKFASAFALAAQIYQPKDQSLAAAFKNKSISAFNMGLAKPGVSQTAPNKAPYFYEEDNWADDMELGAAALYQLTNDKSYFGKAYNYAETEKVTPWMGADTARHYQWYPFHNFGHYEIATKSDRATKAKMIAFYKQGIDKVWQKSKNNAFYRGIPFIWCSNNLTASFAIQCYLYRKLSGDETYSQLEQACFDWLLGCNPWGTSMVFSLPAKGDTPLAPHSSLAQMYNYPLDGGLVDGPVYGSIYKNLIGIKLNDPDEYAEFQSDLAVYHDDYGDYSTNEPTMDGTASLIYLLAAQENDSREGSGKKVVTDSFGAIIRGDVTKKEIALVFTGDEFNDGGEVIRKTLKENNTSASFFLTGNFYRNPNFKSTISNLKKDGHYLGAHSNQHLLYADWIKRDSLLVTKQQFRKDLQDNYKLMAGFGIKKKQAEFFLPPFEWHNRTIVDWARQDGLTLINFTPGTRSNADYTYPEMQNRYVNSETVYKSIIDYEAKDPAGLNGFILLIHIGTDPRRTDKFYTRLDTLLKELKIKGYTFVKVDELLQ